MKTNSTNLLEGAPASRSKDVLFLAALLLLMAAAIWVRFDSITQLGLMRGDSFNYLRQAKRWAEGDPTLMLGRDRDLAFYRPAIYLIHSIAVRLFGYNDNTLKLLHASMDSLNVLLIAVITLFLTRDRLCSILAPLLYAFLPTIVLHSRTELVHIPSATFVLVSFLLFIRATDGNPTPGLRTLMLGLSGFSLGTAASIHTDLAFLGPASILLIVLDSRSIEALLARARRIFLDSFIFTASFFLPFALSGFAFGPRELVRTLNTEITMHSGAGPGEESILNPLWRFFADCTTSIIVAMNAIIPESSLIAPLFGISVAVTAGLLISRRGPNRRAYYPLIFVGCYLALYALYSGSLYTRRARIFIPLLPFVLMHMVVAIGAICRIMSPRFGRAALTFGASLLVLSIGRDYHAKDPLERHVVEFPYKQIYTLLKGDVSEKCRLLITPINFYSFDQGFASEYYFRNNALYSRDLIFDAPSLESLALDQRIHFVLIAETGFDSRNFDILRESPVGWGLQDIYGFGERGEPYSMRREVAEVYRFLFSENARLVAETRLGPIYKIDPGFPVLLKEERKRLSFDYENPPGFRDGTLRLLSDWTDEQAVSGTHSVRITNRPNKTYRCELSDFIEIDHAQMLFGGISTRIEATTESLPMRVFFAYYDKDLRPIQEVATDKQDPINYLSLSWLVTPGKWTREELAISDRSWPKAAAFARIEVLIPRRGRTPACTMYFDDAVIEASRWGSGVP